MTIENFDHGQNKAAGFVNLQNDPGPIVCRAIGIRSAAQENPFSVVLELVEPIGQGEFLPTCNRAEGENGLQTVEWVDPTHVRVTTLSSANELTLGSFWFAFYKVVGNAGAVPITFAIT